MLFKFRSVLLGVMSFLILANCDNKRLENTSLPNEIAASEIKIESSKSIKVSEFSKGMKIIRLETRDDLLLSDIKEIKIFENKLFVTDVIFPGIYIFDFNGKLIFEFNMKGEAGGEYISLDDFLIDESSRTIEILDRENRKIFIYDLDSFEFKNEIRVPITFFSRFTKHKVWYFL